MGLRFLFGSSAHQNLAKTTRLSGYKDPWIQFFRDLGERNSWIFFSIYGYAKFNILLKKEKKKDPEAYFFRIEMKIKDFNISLHIC